jgi:glycosyltransferase involved in cell wall biosynthesis
MLMFKIAVSVVVVTKNEQANIGDCLTSLINQCLADTYEIIVVDAGSSDGTCSIVKTFPVTLAVDSYGTIGHQRNTGAQVASGEYIAFIDADCVADRQWLQTLLAAIRNTDERTLGVGGPNLVSPRDPSFSKVVGFAQETIFGSGGSFQSTNHQAYLDKARSIANCNAIYKKQAVREIRYDDDIGIGEDADFNYRLIEAGYKLLYTSGALVWHHRAKTYQNFVKKCFLYGKAMAKLTLKHNRLMRWFSIVPPIAFLITLCYIARTIIYGSDVYWNYGYISLLILYLLAIVYSTWGVYKKMPSSFALLTVIIIPTQHIAYGWGFLAGMFAWRKA